MAVPVANAEESDPGAEERHRQRVVALVLSAVVSTVVAVSAIAFAMRYYARGEGNEGAAKVGPDTTSTSPSHGPAQESGSVAASGEMQEGSEEANRMNEEARIHAYMLAQRALEEGEV